MTEHYNIQLTEDNAAIESLIKKESNEEWKFPPSLSARTGRPRYAYDQKMFIHLRSSMFDIPVIMMSDLHQHALMAVKKLSKTLDLSNYVVLSVGDMAGKGYYGSDADPTPAYKILADEADVFYFVQGNHDLPAEDGSHLDLINSDGTPCMVQNNEVIATKIGRIAGLNGIASRKPHPYKIPPREYFYLLDTILRRNGKIDIFMTHDTPKLPIGRNYIGNEGIYDKVQTYKPRIHLFGHCHHPTPINSINKVTFINADSRILVFDPINE